ncbi:type 2 isopentenyl-diphosphate Delta-isomerase [Candidatus Levibacter sp. Uisw_134_01]|jgi:isopentenyl-diphosphate Delta-isomerase|uniref:type 2 isopentenyl-diphosphate Delta-isomerase n=1 Tax=Candidatus Levibacter sp. Uisw_134_01 TaxID=3230999 RepID=UPI003D58E8D9
MYSIKDRKIQHLNIAKYQFENEIEYNSLDSVVLPYCALPEIDFDTIDLSVNFLNKRISFPVMISGMTGGTERSNNINKVLVELAEEHNIAMGIGSQRASLETKSSQKFLRKIAKNIPLIGNVGGVQLASPSGIDLIKRAINDIEADAIAVHLNPLQEIVQPEGDHDWRGVLNGISEAVKTLPCPIIVKEVGRGLSKEVIKSLFNVGVRIFDVAGMGGTNWTKIETSRRPSDEQSIYQPFHNIGIPLKKLIIDASSISKDNIIIGSGGIKNGLDVAKAIWLGSDLVSMAGVLLKSLEDKNHKINKKNLDNLLNNLKTQIKISLFITGSKSIYEFREKSIFGEN